MHREGGFTLIEIVIAVIVIGIIASIAIPQFMAQRTRSWEAAAHSDLRNAATIELTHHAEASSFLTTKAQLLAAGLRVSEGVDLWVDPTSTSVRFELRAQHCSGGDQFAISSDGAATTTRIARAARSC